MAEPARDTVRRRLGKAFDETAHPRDPGGRWTTGEGAKIDHDNLWDDDLADITAVNARLDTHLGAIHDAHTQAAEHVKALQGIQTTVASHYQDALDALDAHNEILDRYQDGTHEPIHAEESDEFDRAAGFDKALRASLDALKPHVRGFGLR